MKSRNTFFFIAMAGIAVLTDPVITHAVTHKKIKTQQTKAQVKNITSVKISMDSFREGALDKEASLKLAVSCFAAKQYNDGEEVVDTLLELYPNDELILNKVIDLFLSAQNAEKTLPLFDQLLKVDPQNTALTTKAARAYSWTGRWETALKLLDNVVNTGDTSDAIQREYADVLFNNKQYAKATARYQKIFEANKQKDYAIAFTYKLAGAKEYTEAGKLLNSIEKQYPKDPSVLETKANLALGRQDFSEALKICEELIKRSPKNRTNQTALLIKAEISSWEKDYETSLTSYDRLIKRDNIQKNDFFQLKAYREKGRVLGWMAKYGRATAVYDEAIRAYPQNEGLKAEADAKKNYYRNSYRPAVTAYKKWLAIDPNEAEALFDLGQLYMQNAKWGDASQTYHEMLTMMPEHRQAALAKQKISILSSMKLLQSGAEYFNVKSEWKSINFSSTGFYTSLSYPFQDNLSGFLQLENKSFHFEDSKGSIGQNNIMTGFEYRNMPDILVRGAYGYHANSQNVQNSHLGFLETQSEPLNNIHLGLAFRREEVTDNIDTFRDHLQRSRWQSRLIYDGYRNWNAGLDYDVANYSDGNSSSTTGGDLTAHLLFGQKRLNLTYRLQNYGFSDVYNQPKYWTPSSFTTHALGLELRNYFNDELFQGVNETYYTTSYKIIAEPESNVSHQIRATLYHDWSNRFSTSIEGQYSWATKAFYEDKLLKTDIRWFF
jgi:tetratricopeptide (TPR) repeat protein